MSFHLKIYQFASLVRKKRGSRGLRETSDEIGNVSASTISRVENGNVPDMETFLALCDWLEVSPSELFGNIPEAVDTPEAIAIQLRADKSLDPVAANVLTVLIKSAYQHFSDESKDS